MPGLMDGKVAIVTGAGGGIGREIALAMARAGARVLINDIGASLGGEGRSATPAEETKGLIEAVGGEAAISTESVAEWGTAQKIVQAALVISAGSTQSLTTPASCAMRFFTV